MDNRKTLIDDIMYDVSMHLSADQRNILHESLVRNLKDIKLEKETYELSTDFDDNYKYLNLFINTRRLEGMSETTLKSYSIHAKNLIHFLDKNFRDITTLDIQLYLFEYDKTHNITKRSLDNLRQGVHGWFIWLYENRYIEHDPVAAIHPIAFEKKPVESLTSYEVIALRELNHDRPRERAMIEFLLSTGVRVSELLRVDITDVDFEKNEVTIHSAKKRNKETRKAFLTTEASYYLNKYLEYRKRKGYVNSPALFQANRKTGKRLDEHTVNTLLKEMGKKLGLTKKLTVHMFRKTFATQLNKRGMNPGDIAYLLGHASVATSQSYYIQTQIEVLKGNFFRLT